MLQHPRRLVQSKILSNSSTFTQKSTQQSKSTILSKFPASSISNTSSKPTHISHSHSHSHSRYFSTTIPPTEPVPPTPPKPNPTPIPPPSNPTPTTTTTATTTPKPKFAGENLDNVQRNIKKQFLDRRDNIHSYEKGQFEVATGKKLVEKNSNWLYYLVAMGFGSLGMSFVAVPLYQAFCQMTGSGGQIRRDQQIDELNRYMQRTHQLGDVTLRPIQVTFQATVDPNLQWDFVPCQHDITLRIGETALAFFRAKNNSGKPIIGVSTYNVLPPQAGLYFNKIQCFCFDEQRLRSGEEIDMPVFFFLDPAMADDWRMDNVDQVTLCYTFFQVQEDEVEDLHNLALNSVYPTPSTGQNGQPAPVTHTFTQKVYIVTDESEKEKALEQMARFGAKNGGINVEPTMDTPNVSKTNTAYGAESLVCPIIPPTATHNPSGISLATAAIPRQSE